MDNASQMRRALGRPEALEPPGRAGEFRSLLIALLLAAGLVLLAGGLVFSYRQAYTDTVFQGVKVGGVPVGGMSEEEALTALKPLHQEKFNHTVVLRADGLEWISSIADLGASFDVAAAAEAAYGVGRTARWTGRAISSVRGLDSRLFRWGAWTPGG